MDAAVATNLTLGVVTPYLCGLGGDLFALVWREGPFAYNGSGRAPIAATVDAVREAAGTDVMPSRGPHTVTVPGAVEAWFILLDRFGTRSFSDLARPALRYARDGFPLTGHAAGILERARQAFDAYPEWQAVYAEAGPHSLLRQPGLARTIETLREDGPDAYYRGPIAETTVDHLRSLGALMTLEDLAGHRGGWVDPIRTTYRHVELLELPPNTQGVTALEALNIIEASGALPIEGPDRQHLLLESTKLALADRDRYVTDPDHMSVPPASLVSREWAVERARSIDRARAGRPVAGRFVESGTAYICAADQNGLLVSLIQSNYSGFGSGVTVPGWGINLQNRGAIFSLDPTHVNVIAPRKRTLHTLIPALALRDARPWLVFGTMGGHGQAQIHVQLLVRMVDDGIDPQAAIAAPRWALSTSDWSVVAESRFGPGLLAELSRRGHRVSVAGEFDSQLGHSHAVVLEEHGYAGATDPRAEGAVLGL